MKQTISRCFALLLCFAAAPLWAAAPSKIEASYNVLGFGMTLASVTETFTRTDDNYEIVSVTKAVGLLARLKPETIHVISKGKVTPQGLVPLSYSLTRKADTHKNASAKFNWDKSTLTHTDYKGVLDLPLAKGTQDRLSVLYHLPLLAQSENPEFKFSIADGNNVEDYNFTLAPEQQKVRVQMGEFKTRLISSLPNGEAIKYDIWLATEHDFIPCKIIVTDAKGGELTQVLTQLTITP